MCIFGTIYDIYYEIVRKIPIIGHCERTIVPQWHLKPYLSSGTKDTSIEIHVDHIHRLFLKNVSKFCICRFLPNWLWNFLYGKFFHVFFFKLFTNDTFTNKDKLLRLVSTKKIKKRIFSKKKLFKNLKIRTFWNFETPPNSIFNFFQLLFFINHYLDVYYCSEKTNW